jgi:GDP-D-mannose 3',5'-epimerase
MERVLVTGAGGFIGSHLVKYLKSLGYFVRGIDLKYPEYGKSSADEFIQGDLRDYGECFQAAKNIDHVYHLAANMGGMGFIQKYQSLILRDNMLIDLSMLDAMRSNDVKRIFYSSSACIYPEYLQMTDQDVLALKEDDAYPAQPQDTYGWEKLMTEIMCEWYSKDYGVEVRIARFHNIYGPEGTWQGERAKAPAALCQKIATAKHTKGKSIDIWGNGEQKRSFCYIDDCIQGIVKLMLSDYSKPLNIGQDEVVTINQLADTIMDIAGYHVEKMHVKGFEGVRGRNSDNTKIQEVLGWRPTITLKEGLTKTYDWIEHQIIST